MSSSVSGGSRGGAPGACPLPPPHLFLDQTKAHRAEKKYLETGPPLFQGVDDRPPPPPIARSGSGTECEPA